MIDDNFHMSTSHTTTVAQGPLEINTYDDGHLRIEHDNYYVACEGHSIRLPRSQFLIISRLARTPQRIVSSAELWKQAWGESKPFNAVSLHVYMYRLRRKLIPFGLNIETMVNVGYRLMPKSEEGDG
jgi:DNA-binding response OmpR family regulator